MTSSVMLQSMGALEPEVLVGSAAPEALALSLRTYLEISLVDLAELIREEDPLEVLTLGMF